MIKSLYTTCQTPNITQRKITCSIFSLDVGSRLTIHVTTGASRILTHSPLHPAHMMDMMTTTMTTTTITKRRTWLVVHTSKL